MKKSSLLLLILCTLLVTAQEKKPVVRPKPVKGADSLTVYPGGSVFGSVFSDVEYTVKKPQAAPNSSKSTGGERAFILRRATMGYQYDVNRNVAVRMAYDISASALQEANVEVGGLIPMHSVTFGMMRTMAERTAERFYGYRPLGAMMLERKGLVQEFDRGLRLTGRFADDGSLYYGFEMTNGSGILPEQNMAKHYAFSFGIMPDKGSVVEVYADHEAFDSEKNSVTGKVLYAMRTTDLTFGVEAFYRMNRKFGISGDINPAGGSLFTVLSLDRTLKAVLRIDAMDQDLNNDGKLTASYREATVDVGLDYLPGTDVHLIPNISYGKMLKKGSSPGISDVIMARITAAVSFK